MSISFGSVVADSGVNNCEGVGFYLSFGVTAVNCAASGNATGFNLTSSTVQNCTAYGNKGDGFLSSSGSVILSCVSEANGSNSAGDGFHLTANNNRLEGSFAQQNIGYGLHILAGGNFVFRNVFTNNLQNETSIIGSNYLGTFITDPSQMATANPWANMAP